MKWKVGELTYELQIALVIRIYPVISIALLEPTPKIPEFFSPIRPIKPPLMVEKRDNFEIEHILRKHMLWKKIQYLVKWFDYRDKYNVWYNKEDLSKA